MEIIGPLGWIGWVFGLVSAIIQIHMYRKDRRMGPAKERLFEEALRDRKGQYSEEQIQDLTKLLGDLQRQVRRDIPMQARKVFLESQLEVAGENVALAVKQHEQLRRELQKVAVESRGLPPGLAKVITEEITPPSVERHRQQRKIYLLTLVAFIWIVLPQVPEYILNLSAEALGDSPQPFGGENFVRYITALLLSLLLTFSLPDAHVVRYVHKHRIISLGIVAVGCLFTVACLILISENMRLVYSLSSVGEANYALAFLSTFSLALVGKISYCLYNAIRPIIIARRKSV